MKTTRWLVPGLCALAFAGGLPGCGDDDGTDGVSVDAGDDTAGDDDTTADDDTAGDDDTAADDDTAGDDDTTADDDLVADDDATGDDDLISDDDASGDDDIAGDGGALDDAGTGDDDAGTTGDDAGPEESVDGGELPSEADSGAIGDGGALDADRLAACEEYCTAYFANCEDSTANTYEDQDDCDATCFGSAWPVGNGEPGSISCRLTHATLAASMQTPHCQHSAEVPSMGGCQ